MTLAEDSKLAKTLSSSHANGRYRNAARAIFLKHFERLKKRMDRRDYAPAMHFAQAYLRMGEHEQALGWLKQACEERNVYSLMIASDPLYDPLRTAPQFAKLLKRMKLQF